MLPGFLHLDRQEIRSNLEEGSVLSLLLPLRQIQHQLPLEQEYLSDEEQQRLERFRIEADAWAFYAGRRLIRDFLQEISGVENVEIQLSPKGKPYCPDTRAPAFNLSHGGGNLLLSFSSRVELGVDVESLERQVPTLALAKRYFSPEEQKRVAAADLEEFMRIWTRKEARLKATGDGLTVPAAEVCTLSDPVWHYEEFKVDKHTLAAVAYAGAAQPHRLYRAVF